MRALTSTLAEIVLVGGSGLLVALAANAVTDGVELGRDYFPTVVVDTTDTGTGGTDTDATITADPGAVASEAGDAAEITPPGTTDPPDAEASLATVGSSAEDAAAQQAVADRLAAKGLQPIFFDDVVATFNDPMRGYGLYVFIDARDDAHYREGHIPGALPFDYYHPDATLAEVTAALAAAMKVVIYCNGGDCEDSEFAALFLQGYVADPSSMFVYTGGIAEWREQEMPTERGERDSGDLVNGDR